ncbi:uncharacterized protein PITG_18257 [Phytophthora infestans T30-4]|uniref:Nucleotide-diphospho-sugar transferase n=1 Tax=Phytophthora infestans (strain T30-4) TaxID=403677 RepID=D0NXQ9_PHYIT|nr:uncharacterized protein PITG_18257 [Phytophthora infestans T30-4]EEY67859.1 conserved hypothetical protein [Phytophthora infestans T30-4]|eukprot:XP_002997884.1 conserved hypothetical protein [Phytophthora infestans T30-4]
MHQLLDAETPPDLRCIGWKQTDSCDLKAKEVPTKNRGCDQFVRGGIGGYCLMKDGDTGQEIRVMHTACDSLHPSVTLSILMVIYPKLLVSAYASIRALRAVNCTLSVELWYIESEMDIGNGASLLADIPKILQEEYGPLTLRSITDARVAGFNSKVYAITHTEFEHVLFLDADNVPVRDPSYLFSTPEFVKTGAILWPDFWHPANTIFNINEDSLLWELLDMPFTDMYEQESGQLVIDRTKSSAALRMLSLFAFHDPNLFTRYKLVHGDKDLFRLAWLKTKTPFHMIANPPGIAGTVRETKFCGMSMAQFDTDGEVLFLHRNAKKLKGGLGAKRKPDEQIWSHLQLFQYRASSSHASEKYSVHFFNGAPEFDQTQWCYGESKLAAPNFKTIAWEDTAFPHVEEKLLMYANEAVALLPTSAVEYIVQSDREEAS